MKAVILIPARMASTRLPGKPLALIAGEPMIVHMWKIARAAEFTDVAVACDGEAIKQAVEKAGGRAILTDPALPSGSDRIWSALQQIDPAGAYDVVVNLQGDMPTLDPALIQCCVEVLNDSAADIATLAAPLGAGEMQEPSVVKVVIEGLGIGDSGFGKEKTLIPNPQSPIPLNGRALSFTRKPVEHGYHHIGIYAYKRKALEKFVSLPPSKLEQAEKLEQLRALEAGMHIQVAIVDTVPLGVDTPDTLEKARAWHAKK